MINGLLWKQCVTPRGTMFVNSVRMSLTSDTVTSTFNWRASRTASPYNIRVHTYRHTALATTVRQTAASLVENCINEMIQNSDVRTSKWLLSTTTTYFAVEEWQVLDDVVIITIMQQSEAYSASLLHSIWFCTSWGASSNEISSLWRSSQMTAC